MMGGVTDCLEYFSKRCQTVFNREASSVVVEHCYTPVSRNCFPGLTTETDADGVGGTFCKVMFETDCRTVYRDLSRASRKKRKTVPQTVCKRVPKTLCGGSNCDFVEEKEQCHNKTSSQVRQVPEENCEIVPNKVCKPENSLVPYLDPVTQCKEVPKETCSFGFINKLGETPVVTKWCYDSDNSVISGDLKRRGKVRVDDGDNGGTVQHNLRFPQIDVGDIRLSKERMLQDLESVKNVPGQDLGDEKIDLRTSDPLYLDDSNYAFQDSIRSNFDGDDFDSFQEMINHRFHQNIPSSFQQVVPEDLQLENNSTPNSDTLTKTTANIQKNREAEKSSSSGLTVIFPAGRDESGVKEDNDSDSGPDHENTNIYQLSGLALQLPESLQLEGSTTGFLRQEETTITPAEHSIHSDHQEALKGNNVGKELQQEEQILKDNARIPIRKFVIDGTFTTKRKNQKRKVKTRNKKTQRDMKEKESLKSNLRKGKEQPKKKQVLWKAENVGDFKDLGFDENERTDVSEKLIFESRRVKAEETSFDRQEANSEKSPERFSKIQRANSKTRSEGFSVLKEGDTESRTEVSSDIPRGNSEASSMGFSDIFHIAHQEEEVQEANLEIRPGGFSNTIQNANPGSKSEEYPEVQETNSETRSGGSSGRIGNSNPEINSGEFDIQIGNSEDISKIENIDKFAEVIDNNDTEGNIQRTVIIKNVPGAFKLFGIKNVPEKVFRKIAKKENLNLLSEEITEVFDYNEKLEKEEDDEEQIASKSVDSDKRTESEVEVELVDGVVADKFSKIDSVGVLDVRQNLNKPSAEENEEREELTDVTTSDRVITHADNDNEQSEADKIFEDLGSESDKFDKIDSTIVDSADLKKEKVKLKSINVVDVRITNSSTQGESILQNDKKSGKFIKTEQSVDLPLEIELGVEVSKDDNDESLTDDEDKNSHPLRKLFSSLARRGDTPLEKTIEQTTVINSPRLETLFYEDISPEETESPQDHQKTNSFVLFPNEVSEDNSFRFPEDSEANSLDNIEIPLPPIAVEFNDDDDSFFMNKSNIVNNFKNRFLSNEIIEENDVRLPKAFDDDITHDNWDDPREAVDSSNHVDDPNLDFVEFSSSPVDNSQTEVQSLPVRFEVSSIKSGQFSSPDPVLSVQSVPSSSIGSAHNNLGQLNSSPADGSFSVVSNIQNDPDKHLPVLSQSGHQHDLGHPDTSLSSHPSPLAHSLPTEGPRIFTISPMRFQSASGRIRMPVTLQYGFQPITVRPSQTTADQPKLFDKPLGRKKHIPGPKPFNKPLGKPRVGPRRVNKVTFYQQETVLDKLSSLIQNFRRVIV